MPVSLGPGACRATRATFRRRLLRWFRRHGATCPGGAPAIRIRCWSPSSCCSRPRCRGWRATTTRFLERYPTVHALAAAPPARGAGELGRTGLLPACREPAPAGAGRGGGARGRDSRATRRCCSDCPASGRYTAGAVACFAFERRRRRWIPTWRGCIRRAFHPRARGRRGRRQVWATAAGAGAATRARRVGLQSGDHGAGSAGLYRAGGAVRGMPGEGGMCETGSRNSDDVHGSPEAVSRRSDHRRHRSPCTRSPSVPVDRPRHQRHQREHPRDRRDHRCR